jgi:hypothetical protein
LTVMSVQPMMLMISLAVIHNPRLQKNRLEYSADKICIVHLLARR